MENLLAYLASYVASHYLELIGFVFGAACVWLNAREHVWGWPMGIVSVGVYVYIFYESKLYADMALHVLYVMLGFYGWINWLKGVEGKQLPVSQSSWQEYALLCGLALLCTFWLGFLLSKHTDAASPYWDTSIFCFSLVAQWQLTQKRLENWVTWIGVNIVAIVLYEVRGLHITSVLYIVYLALAIWGYRRWKANMG